MNDGLIKFKEIVNEEIQAYGELGELYEIKQSYLIQGKSDALWDIDEKIIKKADNIKELSKKRKSAAKYFGNEDFTMSDIIEKARAANDNAIADEMELQKKQLRILAESLTLQENTNMTLVKHGLIMVGKTIDIIVGAILPQVQKGQYDKSGQRIRCDKSLISSVVEEV